MIYYKDRAWCTRYYTGICVNHDCCRAFTAEERKNAKKWWGDSNVPLSLGDLRDEECGEIIGDPVDKFLDIVNEF